VNDDAAVKRIREAYARRKRLYEPTTPSVYMAAQELERAVIRWLGSSRLEHQGTLKLLEMGCGSGKNLLRFLQLGFRSENLAGVDLLEERVVAARELLPSGVQLHCGDASGVDLPDAHFDVVFQSMMCSSILDQDLLARVCRKMWSLVRPGGGVLWYDFIFDNPSNPDVRGIRMNELLNLFPARDRYRWRVTLAPPVARLVTRVHPALYAGFNLIPWLRTHRLVWIPKPVSTSGLSCGMV
jgi:SAM-dependent methyltransferase